MSTVLKLAVVLIASFVALSAQAVPVFSFSFSDDAADPIFGRTHVPGSVTGLMYGLSENGAGQLPTAIEFTSSVAFLGMTDSTIDATNFLSFWDPTGFTIVDGSIVSGGFALNFADPVIGSLQFRLNGGIAGSDDQFNILHWNGSSGPFVGTGNRNGFAGATYSLVGATAVPEPESLALFSLGLLGTLLARRRRTAVR